MDSDFVFNRDIYSILDEFTWRDGPLENKPLWCVKHDYKSPNVVKMDNQVQTNYNKKLWSSFMLFTNHWNSAPTIQDVNTKSGSWLHNFSWLKDDEVGKLYEGWNFIPDHSEEHVPSQEIRAIHYTEGSPLMQPGCRYAEVFNNVLRDVLKKAINEPEILG